MITPFSAPVGAYGVVRKMRNAGMMLIALSSFAAAEPVSIVALGDSLTQGYGLPPEQGFVSQLETWLQATDADVNLINAGVSGDTTAGGLSRIEWTLTPDIDGLIVALGGNDLLRGIDPAESRKNLDGILRKATDRGVPILLIGMDAPSNYGSAFEIAFDTMYADLADAYGALLYPNLMGPLTARGDRAATLRDFMQSDAIHPNAKGVALIVDSVGPSVLELIGRVIEAENKK